MTTLFRKSRFLGDGVDDIDDAALSSKQDMTAEILETLKMSNEMCERTIHDICELSLHPTVTDRSSVRYVE